MITFTAICFTHMITYLFTKKTEAFSTDILFSRFPVCCCSVLFDSLWHHGLQHASLPCPSPSPGVCSCPLNRWCHPTISSSVVPLLLLPSIFPSIRVFFQWVGFLHQVTKVLELQHQSFQWIFKIDVLSGWLVWSPCRPRDSKSFPTPQFKRINSLALSFLYSPTLTSTHDYWKNHSPD